jgi:hypothetical protein
LGTFKLLLQGSYFTKESVLAESKIGKPAVPTKPVVLPRPANVMTGQQAHGGSTGGQRTSPNLMTGQQVRGGSTGGQLTSTNLMAGQQAHGGSTGGQPASPNLMIGQQLVEALMEASIHLQI